MKDEHKNYFAHLCDSTVAAFASGNQKELYRSLASILMAAKSRAKVPKHSRVVDADGNVAQSVAEEQQIFREHFASVLGGATFSFETLVVKDRAVSSGRFSQVKPSQLIKCVPTPIDLACKYRSLIKGKGYGETLICSDVFKEFPNEMSWIQFPLVVKAFV